MRLAPLALLAIAAAPAFAGSAPPPTHDTFVYKTVNGLALRADVYRPAGFRRGFLPVVIWLHGGGLCTGSRGTLDPAIARDLITAGFMVVSVDYRLAPNTPLAEILDDVSDSYRWVRAKGPASFSADPSRVAVAGSSAGGYLALTLGYRVPEAPPRAIVTFYGYGGFTVDPAPQPAPHFLPNLPAVTREKADASVAGGEVMDESLRPRWPFLVYGKREGVLAKLMTGHDPLSEPAWFPPYEPARNVTKSFPPTLLFHGSLDEGATANASRTMAAALAKAGVKHELVVNESWRHGFETLQRDEPATRAALTRFKGFLRRHLR